MSIRKLIRIACVLSSTAVHKEGAKKVEWMATEIDKWEPVQKSFRKVLMDPSSHWCYYSNENLSKISFSRIKHSIFIIFISWIRLPNRNRRRERTDVNNEHDCMCDDDNERQETRSKPLQKQLQHFSVSKEHFYRIISYHTIQLLVLLLLLFFRCCFNTSTHTHTHITHVLSIRSLASSLFYTLACSLGKTKGAIDFSLLSNNNLFRWNMMTAMKRMWIKYTLYIWSTYNNNHHHHHIICDDVYVAGPILCAYMRINVKYSWKCWFFLYLSLSLTRYTLFIFHSMDNYYYLKEGKKFLARMRNE